MTPADLVRFGRCGLDHTTARQWAAADITPFEAEVFISAGIDLQAATEVLASGVGALDHVTGEAPMAPDRRSADDAWRRMWDEVCADPPPLQAHLGDLAELTGLTAPRLSTMRREDPEFPRPLSATRSPRFTLAAVLAAPLPRRERSGSDPSLPAPALLARMAARTLAELGLVPDLRRRVAEMVARLDGRLEAEAPSLVGPNPEMVPIWKALERAAAAWLAGATRPRPVHAAEVLDVLLAVIDEVNPTAATSTGPALTRLMVDVVALEPGHTVLDPACGTGELLVAASVRAGRSGTYRGVELDPDLATVARIRLELRALRAEVRCEDWLHHHTWFREPHDAVLLDPPLDDGVDLWVEMAMASLSANGRVAVVALQRDLRPDRALRRLLAEGQVEAEIQIPQRARAEGRMPKYVLVLTGTATAAPQRLPVREDLSTERISISGGRMRTGPSTEPDWDRLGLSTGPLLTALAERRRAIAGSERTPADVARELAELLRADAGGAHHRDLLAALHRFLSAERSDRID